ncbi:glutathione-dependent formaldehyde dehydrogenase [Iamia majanohamensis]|uniref:Glutathione-dependent formaldehyde dehydrogenase n=1 Tax=Iamia majanohamensis TaxID=467976 RepID=A0AAE9YBS2_9ACTN|nr:zinc-dependent alcohol dehydrogenase [Iamia majanohamensis]WCO68203.1 glutathione-dependent formaldehyde dehydrogenase [Iamia majanohamensis]
MRAVTWQGFHDVRVEEVPDPAIEEPTDAVLRITSSGLCGSDLHLYEVLGAFMAEGDVLGHEPMGVVEAVGADVTGLSVGDRVVVPFQIACGHCFMCDRGLQTQCETTQVRDQGMGAALFGYTELYGQVPGAQAEYLRVPHADYGPIKVPDGPADDRFLFLSDVLPTAWQAVAYAEVGPGDTLAVLGQGPIGSMAARIARHQGVETVIVIDPETDRLGRAAEWGAAPLPWEDHDQVVSSVREMTDGRGPDAVIDAVGMEAHGSSVAEAAQKATALLPDAVAKKLMTTGGVDRLAAVSAAIAMVRRGGTISLSGVYGGAADPLPLMTMFDKQVTVRMGQANVRRWSDAILPLLEGDDDPLGVDDFATHHLTLDEAPEAYARFQDKEPGVHKVVFRP